MGSCWGHASQWQGLLLLAARSAVGLLHQRQSPTTCGPTKPERGVPSRPLGGDRHGTNNRGPANAKGSGERDPPGHGGAVCWPRRHGGA